MGTGFYYSSTRVVVLVQQSTIGQLGRMCSYSSVLYWHSGGCTGTIDYCRSIGEAALV